MSNLYPSLDLPKGHIRLLRLLDFSAEPLYFEMSTHELNDNLRYAALSYFWGPPQKDIKVIINGVTTYIATNLHAALQCFQRRKETCFVWADAICINQASNSEKCHQVAMMGSIYAQAIKTIIWLGSPTADSDLAMATILNLEATDLNEPGFSSRTERWVAVKNLFRRRWWRRAWIIQEALLSTNPIVWCGDLDVPLRSFVDFYFHWHEVFPGGVGPQRTDPYLPFSNVPFVTCLGMSRLSRPSDSLFYWIMTASRFEATILRDKVFCVLGLASPADREAVIPNYDKPDGDVWLDVAIVMASTGLDFLGWRCPMTIVQGSFPSWVSDLTVSSPHSFLVLNPDRYKANISAIDPSWDVLAERSELDDQEKLLVSDVHREVRQLILYGIFHDTIVFADPFPIVPRPENASDASAQQEIRSRRHKEAGRVFPHWEDAAFSVPDAYKDTCGRRQAFWRTLICDRDLSGHGPPDSDFGDRRLDTMLQRTGLPNSDEPLKEPWNNSWVRQYSSPALYNTMDRSFVITGKGRYGLVTRGVEAGDSLFIARGGCTPYAVRRLSSGLYSFVGEAYIHGIMDGEAVSTAVQDGTALVRIQLC